MAEQEVLSQISQHINSFGSSTREFRQVAEQHNQNISKVLKDVQSVFSTNKRQLAQLGTQLQGAFSQGQKEVSESIETNTTAVRQSIQLQGSMLNQLENIGSIMQQMQRDMASVASLQRQAGSNTDDKSGSSGSWMDFITKGAGRMWSTLATPIGAAAGAAGGYAMAKGAGGGSNTVDLGRMGFDNNQMGSGDANISAILETIRKRESSGNYQATNGSSTASGAYQFIDSTWQNLSKKYGIGQEYRSAKDAPKEIQDAIAKAYVEEILKQNNGDVSKIPNVWYTGNAEGRMSNSATAVNGGLTSQEYQSNWMSDYSKTVASPQYSQNNNVPPPYNNNQDGQFMGGDQPMGGGEQGGNGKLPQSSLVSVGNNAKLSPEAASAYKAMVEAAQKDGVTWSVTDSYRDYNTQVRLAREKGLYSEGGLAAYPGTSNHGWGTALDLGGGVENRNSKQFQWLQQNAGRFGFKNIPREPWHWELAGTPNSGGGGGGGYGYNQGGGNYMPGINGNNGYRMLNDGSAQGFGRGFGGGYGGSFGGGYGGGYGNSMNPFAALGGMIGGQQGASIGGLLGVGLNIAEMISRKAVDERAMDERSREAMMHRRNEERYRYDREQRQYEERSDNGMDRFTAAFFGSEFAPSWYSELRTAYPYDLKHVKF